ncbi:MAG: periplasmic heavy metal sensor [Desulfobacteraceae bacterium]|nr:periplasmic heavy metal sensor [Desulfobacteraceae bacterium]
MKKSVKQKSAVFTLFIVLFIGSAVVFAQDDGLEKSPYLCPGYGKGPNMTLENSRQALSEEDAAKLRQARASFLEQTNELRQQIRQLNGSMRTEMANQEPDVEELKKMQEELSGLKADLDQKRLTFRLENRKLMPQAAYADGYNCAQGPGRRGRGHGRGYAHHYGRGCGRGGSW